MKTGIVALLLLSTSTHADPGLTLRAGGVQGTVTSETDVSAHKMGDTSSLAPDLSVGVTDDLTISLIHSTFGRTGFRGAAGGGFCIRDAGCPSTYDNAGVEGMYSLLRGQGSVAVDGGVYATSFDHDFYVAKLGMKARYIAGRVTLATLPSVSVALTNRNAMTPNRDRLWLPVSGMVAVGGGVSVGASSGFKAPMDSTLGKSYEIALGAVATYAYSPALSFGASWIEGKLIAGDAALPAGMDGIDSRAFQLWATGTY